MKEEATHDQSGTLRFSRLPARPPPSMATTHAAKDIVFFCLEKECVFCTLLK